MSRALARSGAVAVLAAWSLVGPAAGQQKKDDKQRSEKDKVDQAQAQEIQALVKLVDGVQGGQPAPVDLPVAWQNHFLKATEGKTYVPFTLAVEPGKLTGPSLGVYLRVAKRGAPGPGTAVAAEPQPAGKPDKDKDKDKDKRDDKKAQKSARPEYPFEDVSFVEVKPEPAQPYRLSRAFAVAGGDYDVYVALRERPGAPAGAAAPKTTVHKQPLTVPDFWTNDLTVSSIILADRVEPLSAPLSKEQQAERPYALGMTQIVPAADTKFTKKEELSIVFLIYNTALDANKKPDVTVDYNFHQKAEGSEKFFNKTSPQEFNVKTLPPQFDSTAGHQLVAGQSIPLEAFAEGDYRLEIKVTDKGTGKMLTRDVNFTVTASSVEEAAAATSRVPR